MRTPVYGRADGMLCIFDMCGHVLVYAYNSDLTFTERINAPQTIVSRLSHYKLRGLELSELTKAGGTLTSCCILIQR